MDKETKDELRPEIEVLQAETKAELETLSSENRRRS
jgi:hypothetical protein